EKCIPSVLQSDYPRDKMEIILVDNGSTDGSADFARSLLQKEQINFKIIENNENKGWSPANNQGARVATGEILLFLSNDMEVDKNWIKEIVKIFSLDPKAGVVQCNSISMWDRKTLDSGMNYLDRFG
ncbi:glycosyltransferase, partial [Thermococcus sp. 21S9]